MEILGTKRGWSLSSITLVTIGFLFLADALNSEGQVKPAPHALADSAWKGPEVSFETSSGPAVTQVFVLFERDGKVTETALALTLSQIKMIPNFEDPNYSPLVMRNGERRYEPYYLKLIATPGLSVKTEAVGKYRIDGDRLYIDFPDFSVVGTINGDEIKGEFTERVSNEGGEWAVHRISEGNTPSVSAVDHAPSAGIDPVISAQQAGTIVHRETRADDLGKRGDAKMESQDYLGAIADYGQAIQLHWTGANVSTGGPVGDAPAEYHREVLASLYHRRGVAKGSTGDKLGACEDFHLSCLLGNSVACRKCKDTCN